jgi:hypothetical protein
MEATTKGSERAKPPEGRKNKKVTAENDTDWRTRATRGSDVVESEEEDQPEITIERGVRVAEVSQAEDTSGGSSRQELPYRAVPPVLSTDHERPAAHLSVPGPSDKSYQVRAPVQRPGLAKKLADQSMEAEITLKVKDLAGVSPEVREHLKASMTKTRKPLPFKNKHASLVVAEAELPFQESELEDFSEGVDNFILRYDALDVDELPPINSFMVSTTSDSELPPGSVMISDPIMQYLESLAPDEVPKQVYVARESASLRVVFPSVNYRGEIEAVTDSGSQIVSMSLAVAKMLKLMWDPDVQIFMQSANGGVEKSVGLARNVPFKFGSITVYLQVHIIREPAYKVLLGRPFEVLTESTVQNASDGSQTITLKDPNTGKRCSMPTHSRGKHHESKNPKRATVESVPDEEDRPTEKTADSNIVPPILTAEAGFHQPSRN